MKGGRRPGAGRNRLRIIGGEWRSRRLEFPDLPGLRPTADRLRETLFNWLAPRIEGSRCLDLFAGSGALGLEALSRGAGEVVLVDSHPKAVAQLKANLALLGSDRGRVESREALAYLDGSPTPFDIVFLDPPFRQGLLQACCDGLSAGWLNSGARVYVESEKELADLEWPTGWEVIRESDAGQVKAWLLSVA